MKKPLFAAAISLALATSGNVNAQSHWEEIDDWGHDNSRITKAKVVSVKPIYETIEVARPEQHCWKERSAAYYPPHPRNESYTGTIAGAIAGGALGNQFGKGRGNDAMTVAGALLGASIGNDMTRQVHHRRPPRMERRCETTTRYDTREELVGYRVKYKFRGETYTTRMDRDPGKTIRVRVNVEPVY